MSFSRGGAKDKIGADFKLAKDRRPKRFLFHAEAQSSKAAKNFKNSLSGYFLKFFAALLLCAFA